MLKLTLLAQSNWAYFVPDGVDDDHRCLGIIFDCRTGDEFNFYSIDVLEDIILIVE